MFRFIHKLFPPQRTQTQTPLAFFLQHNLHRVIFILFEKKKRKRKYINIKTVNFVFHCEYVYSSQTVTKTRHTNFALSIKLVLLVSHRMKIMTADIMKSEMNNIRYSEVKGNFLYNIAYFSFTFYQLLWEIFVFVFVFCFSLALFVPIRKIFFIVCLFW